jgi:gamma-glutamyltranspeptidase/glutathione hydrolase
MAVRSRYRDANNAAARAAAVAAMVAAAACTGVREPEPPGPPVVTLRAVGVTSEFGAVAAGTPEAAELGAKILEQGGNAVDAAVAAAFTLAVVDPGDSGLGGITLALIRLADGRTVAIDGASKTPAAFDLDRYIQIEEKGLSSWVAIESSAVPTTLPVLAHMNRMYGTMPLARLIQPAIDHAESGYTLSPFQITAIWRNYWGILNDITLSEMVLTNGYELPEGGEIFYRPALARALRLIRARGPHEFSFGTIAAAYEADMIRRGGWVTRRDLAVVRAREQHPDITDYRGYEIISFPSPGSGASVIEAMNLLETMSPELLREHSVDRTQMLTDVFRIVLSDQQSMMPDPNLHQALRDRTITTEEFTRDRASRLRLGEALQERDAPPVVTSCRPELGDDVQTTQVSVIDRWGNTVSMTSSLGNFYGTRKAVPEFGIIHNNLLGGSCPQGANWAYLSDMAPTIVAYNGRPFLSLGSAGSARISTVIALVMSNMIDRGMTLKEAIEAPRTLWFGTHVFGVLIEVAPPITRAHARDLLARGHEDSQLARFPTTHDELVAFGAVNAVHVDPESGIMSAVGDSRRNGAAVGASR